MNHTLAAGIGAVLAILVFPFIFNVSGNTYQTSLHTLNTVTDDTAVERAYFVHAPKQSVSLPAVVVLHGSGEHAQLAMRESNYNQIAEQNGFVAVYPEGTGTDSSYRSWNGGHCCGDAVSQEIDDVAFLNTLLETLVERHNVDPTSIYVTGISNGALMAYRYVCEGDYRVAGVAGVSGMGAQWQKCALGAAIPLIEIIEYTYDSDRHSTCPDRIEPTLMYASDHVSTHYSSKICSPSVHHDYYYLKGAKHGWNNVRYDTDDDTSKLVSKPAAQITWEFFEQFR